MKRNRKEIRRERLEGRRGREERYEERKKREMKREELKKILEGKKRK